MSDPQLEGSAVVLVWKENGKGRVESGTQILTWRALGRFFEPKRHRQTRKDLFYFLFLKKRFSPFFFFVLLLIFIFSFKSLSPPQALPAVRLHPPGPRLTFFNFKSWGIFIPRGNFQISVRSTCLNMA